MLKTERPIGDDILLSEADLDWSESDTPRSKTRGDYYFSKHGGLAERRHVFLAGNNLLNRWRFLVDEHEAEERSSGRQIFTIGELGFGTGLSFLITWQAWRAFREKLTPAESTAISCAHLSGPLTPALNYLSVEDQPLSAADLRTIHGLWPELAPFSEELQQKYPLPLRGIHQLVFPGDSLTLTLLWGSALEMLPQAVAAVDAWYLDGFSPAVNPELWNREILAELSKLSAHGATFATYSVARTVRESLISIGAEVKRTKGFARKKEMLIGTILGQKA